MKSYQRTFTTEGKDYIPAFDFKVGFLCTVLTRFDTVVLVLSLTNSELLVLSLSCSELVLSFSSSELSVLSLSSSERSTAHS